MAEQAAPPPESVVIAAFKGLKTTATRERLAPGEMLSAVNIDVDSAQQVHRRRGYTKKLAGNCHSLWQGRADTYVVVDGMLGVLAPDYTHRPLIHVGSDPLSYTELADTVYYVSRVTSGKVVLGTTVASWGAANAEGTWLSPVVNPTATLGEIRGKLLAPPPLATSVVEFHGRIYLASGRTLWATELFLPDYVDKTRNFIQFEADIVFLGRVDDGIYVGTEGGVYFLSGTFGSMRRRLSSPVRALTGSLVHVPAEHTRPDRSVSRGAVMFMTDDGLYLGLDDGLCYSMTKDVDFPQAESVAALFQQQDGDMKYIGVMDSRGTPASNTRVGDYVDAEIRRFNGD